MKAVISLSGGLDSTCLLMHLLANGYDEIRAYSFDYGQKHSIELKKVKRNIAFLQSKGYNVQHQIINVRDVFSDSSSSLHVGGDDIPEGHYEDENMKSTVVENRNIIFSAIIYGKALGWANKSGDNVVITLGIHAGDHCFTRDTKILTPKGYKTIDELKIGDSVYSVDENNKIEIDTVSDAVKVATVDEIYKINTTTGYLRVTGDHKIYVISETEKILICAKDIKLGDRILTLENDKLMECRVTDIELEHKTEDVFDITVEKNHNFFAGELGNILVHNCIYPDCRPESHEAARHLFAISNWNSEAVDYIAPFENIDKGEVLGAGIRAMEVLGFTKAEMKKVLRNTHTCYNPDEHGRSCGKCGSCTERLESFENQGLTDPIKYQA